jgi:hypothetical protein
MKRLRVVLALAWAAWPLLAEVSGTLVNRTTGKPAAGVTMRLSALGQGGIKPLARVESGADGAFKFDAPAEGMYLLQATWQGVQYSNNLPPNAPKTGLTMEIFDVQPKLAAAKLAQHIFFLESDGQQLIATEMLIYNNESALTWYDGQHGTARVALPKGVAPDNVTVRVTAPGGLPLDRELTPVGGGLYAVDYPVKPGETRFEVSYVAPDAQTFTGRAIETGAEVRLVVPRGMQAAGEGLEPVGQEPQTGASIYTIKPASFRVTLSGTGSLRAQSNESAQGGAAQGQEEDGPRFEQIPPPGYERNYRVMLALCLAILAAIFGAMYVRGTPRQAGGSGRKA